MPEINPLPVSELTRSRLQAIRHEEESYDELLQRLALEHHRFELSERFHDVAATDADELQPIDEFELLDDVTEFDALVPPSIVTNLEDEMKTRTEQIVKRTFERVADDPFPEPSEDRKSGLPFGGSNWYRYQIERAWFVFYLVDEAAEEVRVVAFEDADEARERYGLAE